MEFMNRRCGSGSAFCCVLDPKRPLECGSNYGVLLVLMKRLTLDLQFFFCLHNALFEALLIRIQIILGSDSL